MNGTDAVRSEAPVALIGGGPGAAADVREVLARARVAVAADGGAAALLAAGRVPDAVIGDFDSIDAATRAAIPAGHLLHVAEQDSTDFHKCLSRIEAPVVLAAGFSGGRMDHLLAVFNVLVRLPERRCIVVGPEDVCVLVPPAIALNLQPGTVVSLFPMGPVGARSTGLHWPLDGLSLAPDGQSGTSNHADGAVMLSSDAPKLLLLLPRDALDLLIDALAGAPFWS